MEPACVQLCVFVFVCVCLCAGACLRVCAYIVDIACNWPVSKRYVYRVYNIMSLIHSCICIYPIYTSVCICIQAHSLTHSHTHTHTHTHQGVGDYYTDPQIHSLDGEGFGSGNMGPEGIRRFFKVCQGGKKSTLLGCLGPWVCACLCQRAYIHIHTHIHTFLLTIRSTRTHTHTDAPMQQSLPMA